MAKAKEVSENVKKRLAARRESRSVPRPPRETREQERQRLIREFHAAIAGDQNLSSPADKNNATREMLASVNAVDDEWDRTFAPQANGIAEPRATPLVAESLVQPVGSGESLASPRVADVSAKVKATLASRREKRGMPATPEDVAKLGVDDGGFRKRYPGGGVVATGGSEISQPVSIASYPAYTAWQQANAGREAAMEEWRRNKAIEQERLAAAAEAMIQRHAADAIGNTQGTSGVAIPGPARSTPGAPVMEGVPDEQAARLERARQAFAEAYQAGVPATDYRSVQAVFGNNASLGDYANMARQQIEAAANGESIGADYVWRGGSDSSFAGDPEKMAEQKAMLRERSKRLMDEQRAGYDRVAAVRQGFSPALAGALSRFRDGNPTDADYIALGLESPEQTRMKMAVYAITGMGQASPPSPEVLKDTLWSFGVGGNVPPQTDGLHQQPYSVPPSVFAALEADARKMKFRPVEWEDKAREAGADERTIQEIAEKVWGAEAWRDRAVSQPAAPPGFIGVPPVGTVLPSGQVRADAGWIPRLLP